jgi:hypothetical protein
MRHAARHDNDPGGNDDAGGDDGFAFHPTALGHEVMAQMIGEALAG